MLRGEDVNDLHVPLLLWWALESKIRNDLPLVLQLLKDPAIWEAPLFRQHIVARLGQRFTAERGDRFSYTLREAEYSTWLTNYVRSRCRTNLKTCSQLLDLAPTMEARDLLIRGMEAGLHGDSVEIDPAPLQQKLSKLALAQPTNAARISLALRLKIDEATPVALRMLGDTTLLEPDRKMLATALAEMRISAAVPVFLDLLEKEPKESVRADVLGGLQRFNNPEIATRILAVYAGLPRHLQVAAQGVLASRSHWAGALLDAVETGRVQPGQVGEVTLTAIRKQANPRQAALIEKYWPNLDKPMSPTEVLQPGAQLGQQSYRSRCTYCHLANGQGMKKSLVNSKWVQGTDRNLIRILLHGKQGEAEVMPGFGAEMDDAQIAAVLTYIRRAWGNEAQPVEASVVREIRSATVDRQKPWTEEELLTFVK
jgi:mono/diheme cytochrome c family protein